MKDFLLLVWIC